MNAAIAISEPTIEEPPVSERTVYLIGGIGGALSVVTLAMGLVLNPEDLAPVRAGLGLLAAIIVGSAISIRPGFFPIWFIAAASAFCLAYGLPPSWDSASTFFYWMTGLCLTIGIMRISPLQVRLAIGFCAIVFHFSGILSAITNPTPQPWISGQTWARIFRPYLHFAYMNNAYQFYSPDPGPARMLWFLVEYLPKDPIKYPIPPQDGEKGYFRWVKVPSRPENCVDPLGQSYYRRLAIAEFISQMNALAFQASPVDRAGAERRRQSREDIPLLPEFSQIHFQPPTGIVQKSYLPSFAKHVATTFTHPEFEVKSVKVYRITHAMLPLPLFRGDGPTKGISVFEPTTFQTFYQGDYDRDGNLLNPNDPMLFWLLPIVRKANVEVKEGFGLKSSPKDFAAYLEEYHRCYQDYIVQHAGYDHQKGGNLP